MSYKYSLAHNQWAYLFSEEKNVSILKGLNLTIYSCKERLEGNSFYRDNEQGILCEEFDTKRDNLIYYSKEASNILEIGFNGGHSCLLFLLSNPTSKIQLFDLGEHSYSRKCFEYLDRIFPGRLSIVWGDSSKTLPEFITKYLSETNMKYDLIHIDGSHDIKILDSDIVNCQKLSSPYTIVIIDDISFHPDHMIKPLTKLVVEKLIERSLIQVVPPLFSNFHIIVKFN